MSSPPNRSSPSEPPPPLYWEAITINGGTVTAIGGEYAAGIGCGYDGNCGNITINNTVTQVTAISGGDQYYAIGVGSYGSCGTVTIGGVIKVIRQPSYTYRPE